MSVVVDRAPDHALVAPAPCAEARIALLGLGQVGSAVTRVLAAHPRGLDVPARVIGALVRHVDAPRDVRCPVTDDPSRLFDAHPTVVVEALGGIEPARTLVLEALGRGIPVVTANKSLLAAHGDEIVRAAQAAGVALRCEASVLAGVPFLGTFARRPLAADLSGVVGILNGTTNYLLTRMAAGATLPQALDEARRLGYAEADPSNDLDGIDAAEKLALLIRQFAGLSVRPAQIHRTSLAAIAPSDLDRARELGGTLKAVGQASWSRDGRVTCAVGPAFLHDHDLLAHLDGVLNGIRLERDSQPLHFTGPGAGPDTTARTILDDVHEVLSGGGDIGLREAAAPARIGRPSTSGWFVRLRSAASLPQPLDVADLLGAHGVWVHRWGARAARPGVIERALLTLPCVGADLDTALAAVTAASGCSAAAFPIVESGHD